MQVCSWIYLSTPYLASSRIYLIIWSTPKSQKSVPPLLHARSCGYFQHTKKKEKEKKKKTYAIEGAMDHFQPFAIAMGLSGRDICMKFAFRRLSVLCIALAFLMVWNTFQLFV